MLTIGRNDSAIYSYKEETIMPKITFMGAGFTVFAKNVLGE